MNTYTGRLDEVAPSHRPACPFLVGDDKACAATMRRNHATGDWTCDLHGSHVPLWTPRSDDVDEDAA